MSNQDEVFGLPFLFTGGLPNSLEKFSEGNLRCFLIYLIEVVGKANRQNVWQKPGWWGSKLIPYSPITLDTSKVPPDQVIRELRSLIESCYKYYKAEKILEVSKQLAEIPRILLGIRDNNDNTMTVYDTNSKAVYVTVRPENLYYDAKSLDKVSKDWRASYNKEDVTFCEIKKASNKADFNSGAVIELLDSDEEEIVKKSPPKSEHKNRHDTNRNHEKRILMNSKKKKSKESHIGVVEKSGNDIIIALYDSDEDVKSESSSPPQPKSRNKSSPKRTKERNRSPSKSKSETKRNYDSDDEVEFVCEFNLKPCPKRFKKFHQRQAMKQKSASVEMSNPNVIILSDTDDEDENNDRICISSYTSLAKDYAHHDAHNKFGQKKSILGPLICSPKGKDAYQAKEVQSPRSERAARKQTVIKKIYSSDEDEFLLPTNEELFVQKKKKKRIFYPPSPTHLQEKSNEKVDFKIKHKDEFMKLFALKSASSPLNDPQPQRSPPDFVAVIRSMKASISRMPLEWIRLMSSPNQIILTKRSSRHLRRDPIRINYEPLCSTNPKFIEYSIKLASRTMRHERWTNKHMGRRGRPKNLLTLEKWLAQTNETSKRNKRVAIRKLRMMQNEDISVLDTLNTGSLIPQFYKLPESVFEKALHSSVELNDFIYF